MTRTITQTGLFLSLLAAVVLVASVPARAGSEAHEHTLKVGKKAGVVLSADTQVGNQTLEAGRYQIQHQADGDQHFVKFIRTDSRKRTETEVLCRMEPEGGKKILATSLTINNAGPTPRVTKIAIRGETASHWLTPQSN